ncbi:MAG: protein kinase [Anaerolineae bacterium]|nr:protein kinase [Anaerolineae bacterium]
MTFFLIGKTLGKYQIVEHIGHGGMAEVYLGEQVQLGRQVAIKILHPFLAEEAGFVSRFQREARIVATLRHPNIVQVFDFDHNDEYGVYYMVMEYIQGATLKERLQAHDIDLDEGVQIAAAIADALDYAHRRGMIHRDIKPANILFTEDQQPVLTDFGIARMVSLTGLTASGAMVGTPAYMAPEIGTGNSATAASDTYSLGVVIYEIVTGHLPFEAEVPMGLVMKHINDPVPLPTRFNPTLPKPLENIILKTLQKKPEARYATAGELATTLRQAMGFDTPLSINGMPLLPASRFGTKPLQLPEHEPLEEELEERLLRSWPPTPAPPPQPETPETEEVSPGILRRRRGILVAVLIVVLALVIGMGWSATGGALPAFIRQWRTGNPDAVSTAEVAEPPTTPTITPVRINTPAPSSTPQPTVNATATALITCVFRAEILRANVTPTDAVVPPGTILRSDITLRNGGECAWPENVHLALSSGDAMGAPNMVSLSPLDVEEQVHVQLYLRAPLEPGDYSTSWEVHLPDGRAISSPIEIAFEVGDLPTLTPTPARETQPTATPLPPLEIAAPVLVEWEADTQRNVWRGALQLAATGGTGTYRFYKDVMRADTEIPEGILTFEWPACSNFPLTIIAASGKDVLLWQGIIDYPDPDGCNR